MNRVSTLLNDGTDSTCGKLFFNKLNKKVNYQHYVFLFFKNIRFSCFLFQNVFLSAMQISYKE